MSSGHWQDAYNQALTMLAIERQDTFVELLQTRIKALESREGEYWYLFGHHLFVKFTAAVQANK